MKAEAAVTGGRGVANDVDRLPGTILTRLRQTRLELGPELRQGWQDPEFEEYLDTLAAVLEHGKSIRADYPSGVSEMCSLLENDALEPPELLIRLGEIYAAEMRERDGF